MKTCWRSASSAEVGSSAIRISGRPISARAAATRCCWPTESSPAGLRQLAVSRSRWRSMRSASARGSAPARSRRRAEKVHGSSTLSIAGSQGSRLNCWNRKPMWSARKRSRARLPRRVMSVPSSSMRPCCGRATPPSRPSSVLLPLPLAPWRKTRSPAASSKRAMSRQFCACRGQRKTRSVIRSAVMDRSLPGEHGILRRQPLLALARGANALGFEAVEALEALEDAVSMTFERGGVGAAKA
jgi:hypothetical protein